jgi:hypothetical protein
MLAALDIALPHSSVTKTAAEGPRHGGFSVRCAGGDCNVKTAAGAFLRAMKMPPDKPPGGPTSLRLTGGFSPHFPDGDRAKTLDDDPVMIVGSCRLFRVKAENSEHRQAPPTIRSDRRFAMRRYLWCAVFFFALCLPASALIALGISTSSPLFIQEFWREGKAHYEITNLTDKEVTVFATAPGGTRAGPWKIGARKSKAFPAPKAKNPAATGYMSFTLDGRGIGAIQPPVDRNVPKEKGRSTCVGYNGNGGRNPNLWMVQEQSRYHGGDMITMTFLVKATSGGFTLARTDDDRLPRGQLFLPPIDVTSETLAVEKDPQKYVVRLGNPKMELEWHRVTARFQAPEVRGLKSAVIMGNWASDPGVGGGGVLARSVVLVPKDAAGEKPKSMNLASLQGAWDSYRPKAGNGLLLLIHGNRIFAMPYEDDERIEPVMLTARQQIGSDTFTLEQQGDKHFLALRNGGRLEFKLEQGTLSILNTAVRRDIWGLSSIRGDYKRGR